MDPLYLELKWNKEPETTFDSQWKQEDFDFSRKRTMLSKKKICVETQFIIGKGIDNLERVDNSRPRLIVIVDFMSECNTSVTDLFSGSHHSNVSVIFITQNIFHQVKGLRTISLNSHYMVVFKTPREAAQISHLDRQLYPLNSKFVSEAYKDATSTPYSYLLLDLKQTTPDDCRCRANIFGERPPGFQIVYQPKTTVKRK
ncbi:hypothetical protein B566_EDAN013225 [Ephemera danica]|nr:hypothetical protein B566_EDAN013225 [Ephemera danica]